MFVVIEKERLNFFGLYAFLFSVAPFTYVMEYFFKEKEKDDLKEKHTSLNIKRTDELAREKK